jgi:5-methylcytosine-specific restriction endonuclease McrA
MKDSRTRRPAHGKLTNDDKAQVVANARKNIEESLKGYREQSLRIHPWICARCGREFTLKTLHMLTVHHKDHNHDNNPPNGSNWENLCIYCHDNEHSRYIDHLAGGTTRLEGDKTESITHNPFAGLADLLKHKE